MLLDIRCVEFNVPVGEEKVECTDMKIQTDLGVIPWKRQSKSLHVTDFSQGKVPRKSASDSLALWKGSGPPSMRQHITLQKKYMVIQEETGKPRIGSNWLHRTIPFGEGIQSFVPALDRKTGPQKTTHKFGLQKQSGKIIKKATTILKTSFTFLSFICTPWQEAFLQEIMADRLYRACKECAHHFLMSRKEMLCCKAEAISVGDYLSLTFPSPWSLSSICS